jgi:hypothetical protein
MQVYLKWITSDKVSCNKSSHSVSRLQLRCGLFSYYDYEKTERPPTNQGLSNTNDCLLLLHVEIMSQKTPGNDYNQVRTLPIHCSLAKRSSSRTKQPKPRLVDA